MIIMLMSREWDMRTHHISCYCNSFVDILSIVCHRHILHHHWLEQGCCTIFPFALCTYWYHSKYTLHKDPNAPSFHQLRTLKTISHIQIHRFNIISMVWKFYELKESRLDYGMIYYLDTNQCYNQLLICPSRRMLFLRQPLQF